MAALGELFKDARGIMSWLGDCAKVIAAENQPVRWTTPLGLPVLQAYYKSKRQVLLESFQTSYPELTFLPLPERGDFDLQQVLESPYFFN